MGMISQEVPSLRLGRPSEAPHAHAGARRGTLPQLKAARKCTSYWKDPCSIWQLRMLGTHPHDLPVAACAPADIVRRGLI